MTSVSFATIVASKLYGQGWCGDAGEEGSIKQRLEHPIIGQRLFLTWPSEFSKKRARVEAPAGGEDGVM